jgi:aldehyde dehydrogenase (NAD+)
VSTLSDIETYGLFVGGGYTAAEDGDTYASVNPTTGETWAHVARASEHDVDRAVETAQRAFESPGWRDLSPTRRGRLMMRFGELIAENAEHLAEIESRENGKLYREMVAQLRSVPDWFHYFGGLADKVQGEVIPLDRPDTLNYVVHEPLGVVGVITAWNSPVLLSVMAVAPALAAGNTIVIKPSEVASAGVLETFALSAEAGFPPGVINVVTGEAATGSALVANPGVAKVAFTGGTPTARKIAEAVGRRLGLSSLELGGKSPNIVFQDAQLEAAEVGLTAGIFGAAGQTCVAGSRALIHASVYDELVERLVRRTDAIRIGAPMDATSEMGPIATGQQRDRIERMVEDARDAGATVLSGGARATVDGLSAAPFYRPTIVTDLDHSSELAQEEVFGPVLSVFRFETDAEAVALANGTEYGLAAGVWTRDIKRAHSIARRLQAGTVWINTYRALAFNSPFGGYKSSGTGRVNGLSSIYEFLQTKSVWCELSENIPDPFVLKLGNS